MNLKRSDSNVFTHCLPLVWLSFLSNFVENNFVFHNLSDNYFYKSNNLFKLSTILSLNYVLMTVSLNHFRWQTFLFSAVFALISGYISSSDSFLCLTLWIFLSNYCYVLLTQKLWPIFRSSFLKSEFLIVLQLSMAYLCPSSACILVKLIDASQTHLFCATNTQNLILQIIFFGIALIVFSEFIIHRRIQRRDHLLDLIVIPFIIFLTYCLLFFILKINPIVWLIEFMFFDDKRVNLLMKWAIILAIILVFTTFYTIVVKSKANTITRKVFHLFISIVYLIGLKNDINFLSFSSASVLAVFIVIEIIRIRRIPPLSDGIESAFNLFRDEKDSGLLTLTHIYLLIGFSLPIWLSPSFRSENTLAMTSGLITLGFGDSAASIGGSLFGRHYWKNTKKTYEGSVCAFFAQIIGSVYSLAYISPEITLNSYLIFTITFVSFITTLIEANIKEIDNLVLPLYHYILIKIFV